MTNPTPPGAPPGPFDGTLVQGHLVADADTLASVERVRGLLHALLNELGMRRLSEDVFDVHTRIAQLGEGEPFADEGGVTGVATGSGAAGAASTGEIVGTVVLSTSHIAIHTWPELRAAQFTLYSCRPFDMERAEKLIGTHLRAEYVATADLSLALAPRSPRCKPASPEMLSAIMRAAAEGRLEALQEPQFAPRGDKEGGEQG